MGARAVMDGMFAEGVMREACEFHGEASEDEVGDGSFGQASQALAKALWEGMAHRATFFEGLGSPAIHRLEEHFEGPWLAAALRSLGELDLARQAELPWKKAKFAGAGACWEPYRALRFPSLHDASIHSWRSGESFIELTFDGYFDDDEMASQGDSSMRALLMRFESPKASMLVEGSRAQPLAAGFWQAGSPEPFAALHGAPLLFDKIRRVDRDEVRLGGGPPALAFASPGGACECLIECSEVQIVWGLRGIGAWRASNEAALISEGAARGSPPSKASRI